MSERLLRTSERTTFKTCRWQWWITYRELLKPEEASPPLRFGDLYHRALAPYYKPGVKRGPHPAKTFEKLYHADAQRHEDEGFRVYSDEVWEDALELGIGMLNNYVERFKDADAEWEVVSSEQVFQVPVRLPKGSFMYVGTLDGVWRNRSSGRLVFKEHKTTSAINLIGLPMDEQAGGYWTFAPEWLQAQGILPEGVNIDHILYTFHRKHVPDEDKPRDAQGRVLNKPTKAALVDHFNGRKWWHPKMTVDEMIAKGGDEALQLGEVSKSQPAPLFHRQPVYRDRADRRNVRKRVVQEVLDMMRCEKDRAMVYKNPGPLYRPNCAGCPVRDMCELHETGQDWKALRDATMVTWEPYAAHELPERW